MNTSRQTIQYLSCEYADVLLEEARRLVDGQHESLRALQTMSSSLLRIQLSVAAIYISAVSALIDDASFGHWAASTLLVAGGIASTWTFWVRPYKVLSYRNLVDSHIDDRDDYMSWLAAHLDLISDGIQQEMTRVACILRISTAFTVVGLLVAAITLMRGAG